MATAVWYSPVTREVPMPTKTRRQFRETSDLGLAR